MDILDVLNERMIDGHGCLIEFTWEEAQALLTEILRGRKIEDAVIHWENSPSRSETDERLRRLAKVLEANPRPEMEAS